MLSFIPLAIQLVPEIASLLFGDKAQETTQAVARAVQQITGADPSAPDGAAAAAGILQAKPELATQLQLQLAEIAVTAERAQRETDASALAAQLAGAVAARKQDTFAAQPRTALQWAPVIISGLVLATFGTVMLLLLTRTLPPGSETILNMLLGSLAAMATSIVSYWVGSSAGSTQKNELLLRSAAQPPVAKVP